MSTFQVGLDCVVVRGELLLHFVQLEVVGQFLPLELDLLLRPLAPLLQLHHALRLGRRAPEVRHLDWGGQTIGK